MANTQQSEQYVLGVDIAKRNHQATLLDKQNHLLSQFSFVNTKAGFAKLDQQLQQQAVSPQQLIVGMEATGHYWLNLYHHLIKQDITTLVLNPLQVAAFRNSGIRGLKTDRVDSQLIAQLISLKAVNGYQPSQQLLALKRLTRFRSDLVGQSSRIKVKLITILDQVFPEFNQLFGDIAAKTSLAVLSRYPTPREINQVKADQLLELIQQASRSQLGEERTQALKQQAQDSVGITLDFDCFSLQIEVLVCQLKHLEKQTKRIEKAIKTLYQQQDSYLTTIPGISVNLGATILAEIGNHKRFAHNSDPVKSLIAFAGLDARPKESGQTNAPRKMSKRGSKYLRTALWQAAAVARQHDPMFAKVYQAQIDRGKHYLVAISHTAVKMLRVVYAIMRDKKAYYPVLTDEG